MAKTLRFTGTQNDVPLTLHDNGDGTYSLQVAVVSDTSGVGGTTTNVVLLDGGATGLNSDAADVTGASGTSIFARLRGVVQLLASIKNAITGTLAVADSALSGLFGTPADAVTGWPDQTVAPVSTTAIEGAQGKDLRAAKGALVDQQTVLPVTNPNDAANMHERLAALLNAVTAQQVISSLPQQTFQDSVTIDGAHSYQTLGRTHQAATGFDYFLAGPLIVETWDGGSWDGTYKFISSAFGNVSEDVAALNVATGAYYAPGVALSGFGPFLVLSNPGVVVGIQRVTYVGGSLVADWGAGGTAFGLGIPGHHGGGVGTIQDAANQLKHLVANASTLVKDRAGLLGRVVVNKAGAAGNTLTLYDGTDNTGAVLAVIDTTAIAQREYQVAFATGLYAVLATGTAADITITYA